MYRSSGERRRDPVEGRGRLRRRRRRDERRGRTPVRPGLRDRPPAALAEERPVGRGGPATEANWHVPTNYKRYLTIVRPLRTRCVALVTRDAVLYAELASVLRERQVPTLSLLPGQRIPSRAAVVLTSPEEAGLIRHEHVVAVPPEGDRTALWAEVEGALSATEPTDLVVGIDPGPRPGYAVLAGDRSIAEGVLEDPEAVGRLSGHLRRRFPARTIRFHVGSGDRPSRDRILTALLATHRSVELVDEGGTTPRDRRRPKDPAAARAIALAPGRPVRDRPASVTTRGEIANLQRLSRESSGGRFTITRHLAERVLRGELTLAEAIADSDRHYAARRSRSGPPEARAAGEHS